MPRSILRVKTIDESLQSSGIRLDNNNKNVLIHSSNLEKSKSKSSTSTKIYSAMISEYNNSISDLNPSETVVMLSSSDHEEGRNNVLNNDVMVSIQGTSRSSDNDQHEEEQCENDIDHPSHICQIQESSNGTNDIDHNNNIATQVAMVESSPSSTISTISTTLVKFGSIIIREYSITLGDNPACSNGIPISIGWTYDPNHQEIPIELFEQYREGYRRDRYSMKMPSEIREEVLKQWGVSIRTIYEVQSETLKIQQQRKETMNQMFRRKKLRQLLRLSFCRIKCNFNEGKINDEKLQHNICIQA